MYKVNTDAAIKGGQSRVGVGIVVRNHSGLMMGSSSQNIVAFFSPQVAEAMAILRGIRFAVDSGLLPAVVESDAKAVVELVNGGVGPLADIGSVVLDFLSFTSRFLISISYVSRKTNMVAHSLTQLALSSDENFFVGVSPSECGGFGSG
ncbi:hypothetical protein Ddye_023912 [Dipteronia dyeriana]|uniref:RNase H type-1 domain-containing protein n=1 Tax=Dipteronia dyeriana TaxID=168575 RepID=A0AAD9WSI3_9ROSI|nr:hypothetical protein Ddye_023912 [Dipteronia dyeriana]